MAGMVERCFDENFDRGGEAPILIYSGPKTKQGAMLPKILLLRLEIIRVLLLRRVLVLLLLKNLHELLQTLHVNLRIHILNI